MKHRKLVLALSLLLMFGLLVVAGCGGETTDTTATTAGPATTASPVTTAGPATTAAPSSETTATTTAPAANATTLVFSFHDPDTNNQWVNIFQPWFAQIEQATNGQVKFEPHFMGELVGLMDAFDAVVKGTVDVAVIRQATMPQFKLDSIIEAGYYSDKCLRPSQVYNELYQKYPEMQTPYKDVKVMLLYCMTPGYLGTTKVPVSKIEDLKGLKLITANQLMADRAAAVGVASVSVPPPEFYPSLEKGVADGGMVVTQPEMISYKWADVIKNVTKIECIRATCAVIMNWDTWNSLPEDVRKTIDGMSVSIVEMADRAMFNANRDALAALPIAPYNINYIEPDAALMQALEAADKPVMEKYVSGLDGEGLPASAFYKDYLELSAKYSDAQYGF
jgi:TRAP-type transport system periplasmic protein